MQEDRAEEAVNELKEQMEKEGVIDSSGAGDEEAGTAGEEKAAEEELHDLNDKYLRLYAEFDNYKKRVAKDKEGLVKYANESLIYDLLPSIDHLDIALKHSGEDAPQALREGVEITLREMLRTLEKFGLKSIESMGRPFDPEFHHAMTQVEKDDVEDNTVVEEYRRGYIYNDKVLRASLVSVSKRPKRAEDETSINYIDEKEE